MGGQFKLADVISISAAAAAGRIVNGQTFWGVSALAGVDPTDTVHAEVAVGYKDYSDDSNHWGQEPDTTAVLGGIYYTPVSQVSIGLEG